MSDLDTRLLTGIYKVLDPLSYEDDTVLDDTVPTGATEQVTEESSTAPVTDDGIFKKFYFKVKFHVHVVQ